MIIKALTLENFKGIREPMRVEFAPLMLLSGPNNAGKSTIVHMWIPYLELIASSNRQEKIYVKDAEKVEPVKKALIHWAKLCGARPTSKGDQTRQFFEGQ